MTEETQAENVVSEPQTTPAAPTGEAMVETPPVPEPIVEIPSVPEQVTEPQTSELIPQPTPETSDGHGTTSEPTAQPVEPLNSEPDSTSSLQAEIDLEPISASTPTPVPPAPEPVSAPEPQPVIIPPPVVIVQDKRSLLAKARDMIQFRKRKKLEKIMNLFLKKQTLTNDDVQKLLYVSDATATRYLQQLEREGKIRQQGSIGHISYSRV